MFIMIAVKLYEPRPAPRGPRGRRKKEGERAARLAPDCILTQIRRPPAKIIRRSGGNVKKCKFSHRNAHIHTLSRPKCSCVQVCIWKVIIEKSQTSQRNNVNLMPLLFWNPFSLQKLLKKYPRVLSTQCVCCISVACCWLLSVGATCLK